MADILPLNDRLTLLSPVAGTTQLDFDFPLTRADGLRLERTRAGATAVLVLGVDYAFPDGLGNAAGGHAVLSTPSLDGDTYALIGRHPEKRVSDWEASQGFSTARLNADMNALTIMAQEHRSQIERAVRAPYGDNPADFSASLFAARDEAVAAKDDAEDARDASAASAGIASGAVVTAVAAKDDAEDARDASAASAGTASGSAAAAATAKGDAETARDAAAGSASAASGSAAAAATAKDDAEDARDASAASAGTASGAAATAVAAKDDAEDARDASAASAGTASGAAATAVAAKDDAEDARDASAASAGTASGAAATAVAAKDDAETARDASAASAGASAGSAGTASGAAATAVAAKDDAETARDAASGYAASLAALANGIAGGSTGQQLRKASNADYDYTWETPAGGGDVSGPAGATDGVMALFDGATGKLLKAGAAPFNGDAAGITSGVLHVSRIPSLAIGKTTGLQAALDAKANTASLGTAAAQDVGTAAGNVPVLDGSGLIPSALLPSYVDDVLEYANLAGFPGTGTAGKIYVALDSNKTYRWSGSAYVEISASPGSTDAVTEGATNLYFTAARVRAVVLTGLSLASGAAVTAADSVLSALGKLQKQITDLAAGLATALQQTDIGSTVQAYDADTLKADSDANLTAGYTATAVNDGTKSSGTYTLTPTGGNYRAITNGGAFTMAAPTASNTYDLSVFITNNGSAGAITFTGFPASFDASALTTTDGDEFDLRIHVRAGVIKHATLVACQ